MLEYIVATLAAIVSEWGIYNASLALLGLTVKESNPRLNGGITFTLIVPAKNEEKVLGRLLERLAHQQYDKDSYEVLVVEDSSADRTYEVCESYARSYQNIKCMKLPPSKVLNGKSRAINEALKVARGNVIGIMDADSVPSLDLLSSVAARFANGAVAVQVKVIPLNARESLVARLAALEELLYEYTLIGRAKLGLFVRLEGTGSFVLKDVINSLNGFNENALTEDSDLSYKLYSMGYRVEYVNDVAVMKEVVPRFSWLVKQRLRWYRGNLELISTSLKGGLNLWKLDSFMTFVSPVMTALYPVTSLLGTLRLRFPDTVGGGDSVCGGFHGLHCHSRNNEETHDRPTLRVHHPHPHEPPGRPQRDGRPHGSEGGEEGLGQNGEERSPLDLRSP
jgi:Glycosyltransferases, probably involved in cell wall biogenesis